SHGWPGAAERRHVQRAAQQVGGAGQAGAAHAVPGADHHWMRGDGHDQEGYFPLQAQRAGHQHYEAVGWRAADSQDIVVQGVPSDQEHRHDVPQAALRARGLGRRPGARARPPAEVFPGATFLMIDHVGWLKQVKVLGGGKRAGTGTIQLGLKFFCLSNFIGALFQLKKMRDSAAKARESGESGSCEQSKKCAQNAFKHALLVLQTAHLSRLRETHDALVGAAGVVTSAMDVMAQWPEKKAPAKPIADAKLSADAKTVTQQPLHLARPTHMTEQAPGAGGGHQLWPGEPPQPYPPNLPDLLRAPLNGMHFPFFRMDECDEEAADGGQRGSTLPEGTNFGLGGRHTPSMPAWERGPRSSSLPSEAPRSASAPSASGPRRQDGSWHEQRPSGATGQGPELYKGTDGSGELFRGSVDEGPAGKGQEGIGGGEEGGDDWDSMMFPQIPQIVTRRGPRLGRDSGSLLMQRSAAQRAAGRQWAKWSADNAVRRLTGELGRTRARLEAAEQALGAVIGDDEVAHRLQAMLPALQATLGGWTPSWLERLRRNVALHAEAQGMDIVAASAAELRSAQRGPRLERRAAADGALRADAPPFVPLGPIGAGAPGGGVPHTPHDANQLLADLIAYAAPMQEALLGEGCQHAQTDGIDTELEAADGGSGGPQLGGPQGAAAARARDLAELHDAFVEEVFVSANEAFGVQDDLNQLMADLAAELGGEADSRYAAAAEPGPGTGGFSPPKSQSQGRGEFEKPHDAEVNAAGIAELDALYAAAGGTALVHGSGARARGGFAQEAALGGGTAGTSEPIGLSEAAGGEVLLQTSEGTNSSAVAAEAVAEQDACADLSAGDLRERHSEPSPTAPEKASGQWRSASDELRGATSALLMDLEAQLAAVWEWADPRRPAGAGAPESEYARAARAAAPEPWQQGPPDEPARPPNGDRHGQPRRRAPRHRDQREYAGGPTEVEVHDDQGVQACCQLFPGTGGQGQAVKGASSCLMQ
ncbi:unnamed protein product, partial [Prorocentrum cordatum]